MFSTATISGSINQAKPSVNLYSLQLWAPQIQVCGFTSNSGLITGSAANAAIYLGTWNLPLGLGYGQDAFFDVTSYLQSINGAYVGFVLRDTQDSGFDIFSSIEYYYGYPSQLTVSTVPVPGTIVLMLSGLAGLIGIHRIKGSE
ncbi:MAG: hypothetical protein ABSC11_08875 [Smithella sp.]